MSFLFLFIFINEYIYFLYMYMYNIAYISDDGKLIKKNNFIIMTTG